MKLAILVLATAFLANCADNPRSLLPSGLAEGISGTPINNGNNGTAETVKTLKLTGTQIIGGLANGNCTLYIAAEEHKAGDHSEHFLMQVRAKVHQGAKISAMVLEPWSYQLIDSDGDGINDKQVFSEADSSKPDSELVLAGLARTVEGEWNPGDWRKYEADGTLEQYAMAQFKNNSFEDFEEALEQSLSSGTPAGQLDNLNKLSMEIMHGTHADPVKCANFKNPEVVDFAFEFEGDHGHDHEEGDEHDHEGQDHEEEGDEHDHEGHDHEEESEPQIDEHEDHGHEGHKH